MFELFVLHQHRSTEVWRNGVIRVARIFDLRQVLMLAFTYAKYLLWATIYDVQGIFARKHRLP